MITKSIDKFKEVIPKRQKRDETIMITEPDIISMKIKTIPIKLTLFKCKNKIFRVESPDGLPHDLGYKIYYGDVEFDEVPNINHINTIIYRLRNKIIELLKES